MQDKTNVIRILDSKKVEYTPHYYNPKEAIAGVEVANALGENVDSVFKTLVTRSNTGGFFVFVIPVACELDLKKAAKIVGQKSVEMIKQKELLPLTGYIHGGCSPIGMKKFFRTTIHESAKEQEKIFVSAGKVGVQIELKLEGLEKVIRVGYGDIVK